MNFGVLNIAITHWNQHTFVKYLIANERQKNDRMKKNQTERNPHLLHSTISIFNLQ